MRIHGAALAGLSAESSWRVGGHAPLGRDVTRPRRRGIDPAGAMWGASPR